ncbi:beta-galactosidase [Microbacterium sp. GXS0129]|uniref:glycoside hydrolase family 35 protein n=1 Tax=Microbacterium sp. GXS0129 TaxID=3377836 RepID=UPI00383B531D
MTTNPQTFTIGEESFLLAGRPFRILAGALHYFRVHPDHWRDRIRKARLLGLNTIETYVAWNAHEPYRGEWDASGGLDLGRFLDIVAEEGMYAIVRPGPYICAEWHGGGLPSWLTSIPGIGLRRSEPQYLAILTEYLRRVYDIVAPRQIDRGGNVILVQIENEYGAYGDDKEYLAELVRVTREGGITVPLTTVDQPEPQMLRDGSLPGLHLTGSFGSRATERLATLREHQPTGPLMCSEFWDGWFDWWGTKHHTTSAAESARELDALLAAGASVNLYMFHGGTNFGLSNGANDKGRYLPIVTSYDYDAPLSESGEPTEKFWAFRDVIAKYADVPGTVPGAGASDAIGSGTEAHAEGAASGVLAARAPAPAFDVALTPAGSWIGRSAAGTFPQPPTFDELGVPGGVLVYTTELPAGAAGILTVAEIRDQAWVSVDGMPVGTISRTRSERSIRIPAGRRLTILVEEQGRTNYGPRIGEAKGLIGPALLDGAELSGWDVEVIAERDLVARASVPGPVETALIAPVWTGEFDLAEAADLFLDAAGARKGFAFVNGFFLGRYWRNGPQRTLYVPAPVTRAGRNTVTLLELEHLDAPALTFAPHPVLGPTDE